MAVRRGAAEGERNSSKSSLHSLLDRLHVSDLDCFLRRDLDCRSVSCFRDLNCRSFPCFRDVDPKDWNALWEFDGVQQREKALFSRCSPRSLHYRLLREFKPHLLTFLESLVRTFCPFQDQCRNGVKRREKTTSSRCSS